MCFDCAARYVLEIGDDVDYDLDAVPWPPLTDEMRELATRVDAFYDLPRCGAGGPLHIVLDDYNLKDSNLDFCERLLRESEYVGVADDARAILGLFRPMSLPERATALALRDGWLP